MFKQYLQDLTAEQKAEQKKMMEKYNPASYSFWNILAREKISTIEGILTYGIGAYIFLLLAILIGVSSDKKDLFSIGIPAISFCLFFPLLNTFKRNRTTGYQKGPLIGKHLLLLHEARKAGNYRALLFFVNKILSLYRENGEEIKKFGDSHEALIDELIRFREVMSLNISVNISSSLCARYNLSSNYCAGILYEIGPNMEEKHITSELILKSIPPKKFWERCCEKPEEYQERSDKYESKSIRWTYELQAIDPALRASLNGLIPASFKSIIPQETIDDTLNYLQYNFPESICSAIEDYLHPESGNIGTKLYDILVETLIADPFLETMYETTPLSEDVITIIASYC